MKYNIDYELEKDVEEMTLKKEDIKKHTLNHKNCDLKDMDMND